MTDPSAARVLKMLRARGEATGVRQMSQKRVLQLSPPVPQMAEGMAY